jgi:hypothetical protein
MPDETAADKVAALKTTIRARKSPNPFSHMVKSICEVTLIDDPRDPGYGIDENPIRIALVSMPTFHFDIETRSSFPMQVALPAGFDAAWFERKLVAFRREISARMLDVFDQALRAAIAHAPHVVCFNELGLPSEDMVPMIEAKKLAFDASRTHNMLIIAGSAHDGRSLYNTGYLFRPGGPPEGHTFHKMISAPAVGELVSVPALRRVIAVKFAKLSIATMICLDIADYALIASVVKVADDIDLLLVPCYTPKFEAMARIADVASKALPGVVALVNVEDPAATAKSRYIARFGVSEAPQTAEVLSSGAIVSILEIDVPAFSEKRTTLKTYPPAETQFLFGNRDVPVVYTT